ncbi:MAG: FHA domain-containing protein [Kiritimatiellaeota bacterium]|nr:FHA domain-containing protein [Kiritimatiellota bacterium]
MTPFTLIVEQGPDTGKRFPVPPEGAGIGRASQNVVMLTDAELSRQHCRVAFRAEALWVEDLGSANGTRVNGAEVREAALKDGDVIAVGQSTLRVAGGANDTPSVVDLGLSPEQGETASPVSGRHVLRLVLTGVATVALLLALAAAGLWMRQPSAPQGTPLAPTEALKGLEVRLVRLEGTEQNVFRYELTLTPDGMLSVAIDDVMASRHGRFASEKPAQETVMRDIEHAIEQSGFFALDESITGVPRENVLQQSDMTVIIGAKAKRVKVAHRPEPEAFGKVRERLETFARNELGLWAVEFSTEQLVERAQDSLSLARRRAMEREIKTGNLFEATQRFRECLFYLETVEPKPDFHADALRELASAEQSLSDTYETWNVDADRSIKLKEWEDALGTLRRIMELIPNPDDDRNRDAQRRLLDVEARLRALKSRR